MHSDSVFLISALRSVVSHPESPLWSKEIFSESFWQALFGMAARQGVLAIVYDVVKDLPQEQQPMRNLKIQWALSVESIECRYEKQHNISAFLADSFSEQGINTVVLKGLAISGYYPIPSHRECGDLDCWLGADYEIGNQICEKLAARVNRDYYKDSTIIYRGLMVENHRFILPIRGSRKMKTLERYLQNIALKDERSFISGTKLIKPSADFNALFLTAHGINHFLSEGIKLRHILDWALFLKAEQNNINWEEFYHWTDRMNMTRFADALTAISVEYFGLQITNTAIHTTSPYAERILHDTLYNSGNVFNQNASAWRKRLMLVRNKLSYGWKYHKIAQKSIIIELLRTIFAFVFERNPKL